MPREANPAAKPNAQKTIKVIEIYENDDGSQKIGNIHHCLLTNVITFADLYTAASLSSESSQLNCIFRIADRLGIELCTSPAREMNIQEAVIYLSSKVNRTITQLLLEEIFSL